MLNIFSTLLFIINYKENHQDSYSWKCSELPRNIFYQLLTTQEHNGRVLCIYGLDCTKKSELKGFIQQREENHFTKPIYSRKTTRIRILVKETCTTWLQQIISGFLTSRNSWLGRNSYWMRKSSIYINILWS